MKEILYNPVFSQEKFNRAKEKIKVNLSSMPQSAVSRAIEELYRGHPYGNSARKILEEIDNVTLEDVINFYNSIISNSQAVAVMTGPTSKNPGIKTDIINFLQNKLPVYKQFNYVNDVNVPLLKNTKVITQAEERNQAHIVQMFRIRESGNVKDQAAVYLLNKILGGDSQSRLFMDLREGQKLAYKVCSSYTTNNKTGELTLEIKTTTRSNKPDQYLNLQKALNGFKSNINRLIHTPVSQEELEGAKLSLKSDLIFTAESSQNVNGMILDGFNSPYGAVYNKELFDIIDKITPSDIQNAAKIYLTNPSVISIIASKDTLEKNKDYLLNLGQLVTF